MPLFNKGKSDLAHKKYDLMKYLGWRNLPREHMAWIKEHLIYRWEVVEEHHMKYEELLLKQLPPRLSVLTKFHIYDRFLRPLPFLC